MLRSLVLEQQLDLQIVRGVNRLGILARGLPLLLLPWLAFAEVLSNHDVDFKRLGCVHLIPLELESGPHPYGFESFEPCTLRYLKLIVLDGECRVKRVTLREYANPDVWEAHFAASDPRLNRLFDAGRETFRQKAVDVFMDCRSRERAGWLRDSFFTARVAGHLCGDTVGEQNVLENFRLPERFAPLPPICYPADHNDGVFIPNWALWFVVQLERITGSGLIIQTLWLAANTLPSHPRPSWLVPCASNCPVAGIM